MNNMQTFLAAVSFLLFQLSPAYGEYYKKVNEQVKFENANAKCQEIYGTDLASLHSDRDWKSALATCGSSGPCWLGGIHGTVNKNDDSTTYEVSTDFINYNWQWMDGSEWNYNNWGEFNNVPQGEGRTGEYFTCIWDIWHQQNAAGVGDCGTNTQFYPICNAPSPIKCEQTQECARQELVAEYVYCPAYRACVNSQIRSDNLFIQGHRSVEGMTQITAHKIMCYGAAGAPGAYMYSDGIEVMNVYFYGFACGNGATVHCADGSTCNIYCDGKWGCLGLTVTYDNDSQINIDPTDCQLPQNQDHIINGVKCPKEVKQI